MSIIQQKEEINRQFISLGSAITLIAEYEKISNKEVILWFIGQEELFKKQLLLVKKSDYLLTEFRPVSQETGDYYEYPYDCLIAFFVFCINEDDFEKITNVGVLGFARKKFLLTLSLLGIDVKQEDLDYSKSYIPKYYDDEDAHTISTYTYVFDHLSELEYENTQLRKANTTESKITPLLECIEDNYCTKYDEIRAENVQLKQRIAELEQQLKQSQQSQIKLDKPSSIDLLTYILDPTQENYAPDLALSIQLYKYVYIDSPRQDSHSSKANTWIKQNTDYDSSNQSGSRIREITAPLNGWNRQRDKKFIKS